MKAKFLRRTSHKYSKLGKGRKKKQKWRRPTGRDNKMREKRKGYGAVVSIGYKSGSKKEKQLIINNLTDLETIGELKEITLGKLGKKKKLEIIKKAQNMKIKILNVNEKKYLKKNQKIIKKPEENPIKETKEEKKEK
jgi:large subunit ribosomal protein L32e